MIVEEFSRRDCREEWHAEQEGERELEMITFIEREKDVEERDIALVNQMFVRHI